MQNMDDRIEAAKESVNRCRNEIKSPTGHGFHSVIGHLVPGDIKYRQPVEQFITIVYKNGFVVMPEEDFLKLSKIKKNRLLKGHIESEYTADVECNA